MPGVDIEAVAGQGAGANMEDDGQTFSADGVEDLLHEDQTLAAREIGYAPSSQRKSFAGGGRRMLAFRLNEDQFFAPQIFLAIGDGSRIPATHGGRAGNWISARRLGDVDL